MDQQFFNLKINKLILHQVFSLGDERNLIEPKYNSELTTLPPDGLGEFQQRILQSVGKKSSSIEMEISNPTENATFQYILEFLQAEANDSSNKAETSFIDNSKKIAYKLASSYSTRRIPGGIVIIFSGTMGIHNNRFIGIIKAEKQTGFSLIDSDEEMLLNFLTDLLLTPNQKLYKIALYIENTLLEYSDIDSNTANNFKIYLYDKNMSLNDTTKAALYFYQTFLGCSIKQSDKKYTLDFYEATKRFINTSSLDDEKKVDCINALHTYLKVDNSSIIHASQFAEDYLPDAQTKNNYVNFIEEQGIPTRAITKDIEFIRNRLSTRKLNFSSKVRISAPSEQFDDLVKVTKGDSGQTIVSIKGVILEQQ